MSKASGASLIDLQIMWHRLIAVVEEQAQVLLRTAFSPIVRECGDLSAGVFDLKGRMLAQAVTGTPGHVNSMAESVKHFIAHFPIETMKPGDAYITNDPWMGTGHPNDFVVTTPCFKDGKAVALFSCTSHLMDIGGIGFGPDATDVFMEGLYIPMLKLIDQGVVNETLMAMIRSNTRLPIDTEGDTYSLAGCNDVGAKRLVEMMDEFGIDTLDPLAEHICDRSREAVMAEIARLPKGIWHNMMTVTSNGGTGARPDKDGLSATAYPSGVRGTPVEIAESQTPLIFWKKELRPDSGGAGRTQGGHGQIIEIESGVGRPWDILAAFDRIDHPARGRDGGGDGQAGYVGLKSGQKMRGKGFQEVPPGDRLVVHTPGGGGIGAPDERKAERVARDLADELVTPGTARDLYGYTPVKAAE